MNTVTQPLDDRTFESLEVLSPEQQKASADYFAAKGYEISTEPSEGETPKPAEEPKTEPSKDAAPPVEAPPSTEDHDADDPESRAELLAAKTDDQKLGYNAKRTKKINELKESVAERDRRLETAAQELAELKGRLAERERMPAPASASPLQPPAPAVEVKPPEPPKAREFSKTKPEAPDYNNFLDEADPIAALAVATAKYAEELTDWKLEKRDFETSETRRIESETNQQTSRKEQLDNKFSEARKAHADFDTVTKTADYSGMLGGILMEMLDDGLDLGYHLALPEHAEVRKKINEYTANINSDKDPIGAQKAMNRAIQDLAVFRHMLSTKAPEPPVAAPPKASVPPPAAVPAPPAAVAPPPVVPPSNGQPRREEAAPSYVKGRSAEPAVRLEDVPADDYDARRAVRKQLGML